MKYITVKPLDVHVSTILFLFKYSLHMLHPIREIAQSMNWADLYVAFEVRLLAPLHILAHFMNWAEMNCPVREMGKSNEASSENWQFHGWGLTHIIHEMNA
jgi:hypothetical protein